jgi:hypothetical protein
MVFMLSLSSATLNAQNVIKPPRGYSTQVGNIVSMMEDLKGRVTNSVRRS